MADVAALLDDGAIVGMTLADVPDLFLPGSSFHALRQLTDADPPQHWNATDVAFANQCVRGLVAIVAFQLRGLAQLAEAAGYAPLHPLVTLVRGVGEAAGALWWHVEPWIDRRPAGAETADRAEWARRAKTVVVRAQLRHVVELANRRRRRNASYGETSDEAVEAERALASRQAELEALYGDTASFRNRSTNWKLAGESTPQWGVLVHHALEFGHGQDHDGQMDNRIYPMLSGFAHPSVEMLYANTAETGPISPHLACSPSEAKLLVSTAGRMAAAAEDVPLLVEVRW